MNTIEEDFLTLYEPIHDSLSRFCRAISGNAVDAEDLLHDTIIAALDRFKNINDKNAFQAYLFSIASNLNKMRMRKKKFLAEFSDYELKQIIDRGQNQEAIADFNIVYEQILNLPQKTAEALILFHISDLPMNEIQKIQGGSLSGVKLRLKRGREKLLSKLNTEQQKKVAMYLFSL